MHSVMTRGIEDVFKWPQFRDYFRVEPEHVKLSQLKMS